MLEHVTASGSLTLKGQKLAAELYGPAIAAMQKWLADDEASAQSRYGELSQVVLNTALSDRYLREDIAIETFVRVLVPTLRKLDNGEFDPNRGVTFSTYFRGACRNRFGDVINSHHARLIALRHDTKELIERVHHDARYAHVAPEPDDIVEGLELARDLLCNAPWHLRLALLLVTHEGVTLTEAAKRVGVKPATLRSQLARYKQYLVGLHFRGVVDIPVGTGLGDWVRTTLEQRRLAAEARAEQTVA